MISGTRRIRPATSRLLRGIAILGVLLGMNSIVPAADDDPLFAPMKADLARTKTLDWAAAQGLTDRNQIEAIGKLWAIGEDTPSAENVLARVVRTFSMTSPAVSRLVQSCQQGSTQRLELDLITASDADPFFATNLKCYVGRSMTQMEMYDEALELFSRVDQSQVVDPASFFFFKAVCEHSLLQKQAGLATLKNLLKNTTEVPVRYRSVAELMQSDLQALKEKSLDEVARMMSDVERRLGLGRGGERVQKVEEEIIASLDELIKKAEQQQGGGSGQAGGNAPSSPAQDSRVKGSTAPGEVDERDIGKKSGWGSLPPKARARARNLIDRELPPHYRSAIEQYLRKLAARREAEGTRSPESDASR